MGGCLKGGSTRRNASRNFFSHAAHPVIIHGSSRLISADFPGSAVARLKGQFNGKIETLFAQACGADINADPLRGGFFDGISKDLVPKYGQEAVMVGCIEPLKLAVIRSVDSDSSP